MGPLTGTGWRGPERPLLELRVHRLIGGWLGEATAVRGVNLEFSVDAKEQREK